MIVALIALWAVILTIVVLPIICIAQAVSESREAIRPITYAE